MDSKIGLAIQFTGIFLIAVLSLFLKRSLKSLETLLSNIEVEGASERLTIGVSFGFKDFADVSELERAVKTADGEMYRRKQERKAIKQPRNNFVPPIQEILRF